MLNKLLNRKIQNYKIKKISISTWQKNHISRIAKLKIKNIKFYYIIKGLIKEAVRRESLEISSLI